MPRRDYASEVSYDRIDDRRDSGYRRGAPVRERERDSETYIREDRGPAFLRDDYGRSAAGQMVLRKSVTEDFDYARPRSLSPTRSRADRRETIVVKRDESDSRVPRRRGRDKETSEREEIVIRRNESETRDTRHSRVGRGEEEREEIIIRRDERESDRGGRYRDDGRGREEIIIRREEKERAPPPPPPEFERERDEIIIRRERDMSRNRPVYEEPRREVRESIVIRKDDRDFDDRGTAFTGRRRADESVVIAREASRERPRTASRRSRSSSSSEAEIIIRRDERTTRNGERKSEEIVIRKHSRSRSRSSSPTVVSARVPLEDPIVRAPPIHQEIITHHRHIDHGYEVLNPYPRAVPRPISRPPSPPMPPPPPIPAVSTVSEEKIEIRRSESRNGRGVEEDIIIKRGESRREPEYRPPPERRVENMEISLRRFEGDRERDRYLYEDDRYAVGRGVIPRASTGDIGRRYGRERDPTAGLWTEITKDLVVKEAIEEMGYEYEETDEFYYVIAYLRYDDVSRLVGLSEDIKKDRRRRIKEIGWETRVLPEARVEDRRLAIEAGPYSPSRYGGGGWDREDERYIEREVVYRGGRPPPPMGWRR